MMRKLLSAIAICVLLLVPITAWADEAGQNSQAAQGLNTGTGTSVPTSVTPAAPTTVTPAVDAGVYNMVSAVRSNASLEIKGASTKKAAVAQINTYAYKPNQRWRLSVLPDGYCKIINVNSGKVLGVKGGKAKAGSVVAQYTWKDTASMKWAVQKAKGGYILFSALSEKLVLTVKGSSKKDGAKVVLATNKQAKGQIWKMKAIKPVLSDGFYTFTNKNSKKRLEVAGGSFGNKANAQQYAKNNSLSQTFEVTYDAKTGYYSLRSAVSGKRLSAASAANKSGTNVFFYTANKKALQKWHIAKNKDGSLTLRSATGGCCLSVKSGSKANAANVQLYTKNGTPQRWTAKKVSTWLPEGTYYIYSSKARKNVVGIKGKKLDSGINVHMQSPLGTSSQRFYLRKAGNGYTIQNVNSGLYLDAASTASGANVAQTASAEVWVPVLTNNGVVFQLQSNPAVVLDLAGASTKAGANVRVASYTKKSNQKWLLRKTNMLDDGNYYLISKANAGYALDISGGTLHIDDKGSNVSGQRFSIKHVKSGKYRLVNISSGKALSVDGANVVQKAVANKSAQLWKPTLVTGGISFVSCADASKILTLGGSVKSGTKVLASASGSTSKQTWTLSAIKGGVTSYDQLSITKTQLANIEGYSMNIIDPSKGSKYRFLDLRTYTGCTAAQLDKAMLKMAPWIGPGNPLYKSGKYFVEAAKKYNVNEVFLMVHACQETGWGASAYFGGYYNFYGVDGGTGTAAGAGSNAARYGWTSIRKGIVGGAKFIADEWVYRKNYPQHSPYALITDYNYVNKTKQYSYHHYTTYASWLDTTASHIAEVYKYTGRSKYADFVKPRFK